MNIARITCLPCVRGGGICEANDGGVVKKPTVTFGDRPRYTRGILVLKYCPLRRLCRQLSRRESQVVVFCGCRGELWSPVVRNYLPLSLALLDSSPLKGRQAVVGGCRGTFHIRLKKAVIQQNHLTKLHLGYILILLNYAKIFNGGNRFEYSYP